MKTPKYKHEFTGTILAILFLMGYVSPVASQSSLFNFIRKVEVKSNDHFKDNTVPGVSSNEIFSYRGRTELYH